MIANESALNSVIVFSATAITCFFLLREAWQGWTLFAFGWATFYLLGGVRMMPWKSRCQKAFSLAVALATIVTTIEFLYKL
jgi:hypothetical protein